MLERVITAVMILFGIAAVYIFVNALRMDIPSDSVAIIEILLIVVLAILSQTLVLIKIYDQHN